MMRRQSIQLPSLDLTTEKGATMLVTAFIKSQDRKTSTRNLYSRNVAAFLRWVLATGRDVRQLAPADIIAYKDALLTQGLSSLTVAGYINAIRRFYRWTSSEGIYPDIAAQVTAPKRVRDYRKRPLSLEQVQRLLAYADTLGPRDRALINLMIRTGLRCIEVTRANVGDIKYVGENNTRVLYVQGKGRDEKDNFVVLTDKTYAALQDYIRARGRVRKNSPLFASESYHHASADRHEHDTDYDPTRLSTRAVSGIVKTALKAIGLNDAAFTAHSLRHTVGTSILRAGGTLEQAQMALRHSNPATTEIYIRMALEERRLSEGGEQLIDRIYASGTAATIESGS